MTTSESLAASAAVRPYRILSFDGGGVHALSYLPVLEDLEDYLGRGLAESGHFDLFVGTSTGAIVATALHLGCPAAEVTRLYMDSAKKIFTPDHLWNRLFHRYSSGPLRQCLSEFFSRFPKKSRLPGLTWADLARSNTDARPELVVTLWDVLRSRTTFLSTRLGRQGDLPGWFAADLIEARLDDLITACCCGPYYFPPRAFGRKHMGKPTVYCDGGITGLNNPAVLGTALALGQLSQGAGRRPIHVLSFGSGKWKPNVDVRQLRQWTAGHAAVHAIQALMQSSARLMNDFYHIMGGPLGVEKYFRTDCERPADAGLDDVRRLTELRDRFTNRQIHYSLYATGGGGHRPPVVERKLTRQGSPQLWRDEFELPRGERGAAPPAEEPRPEPVPLAWYAAGWPRLLATLVWRLPLFVLAALGWTADRAVQVVGHLPGWLLAAKRLLVKGVVAGLSWSNDLIRKLIDWIKKSLLTDADAADPGEPTPAPVRPRKPPVRSWEVRASWSDNPTLTGYVGTAASLLIGLVVLAVVFNRLPGDAEEKQEQAENAGRQAVAAGQQALEARRVAEEEKDKAERQSRDSALQSYAANVQLAGSLWHEGRPGKARQLLGKLQLAGHLPGGFEWHYLDRLTARTGRPAPDGHSDIVWGLAFSPDGRHLVSGSFDKTVKVWDVADGRFALRHCFKEPGERVFGVAVSRDGTRIAAAGGDHVVWVWDVERRGAEPRPLRAHEDEVNGVAFSPDGTRLASASDDGKVLLWDLAKPDQPPRVLEGHTGIVWAVAFHADGKHLASAGSDGTVRVWDADTARKIAVFDEQRKRKYTGVVAVAFNGDGTRLISGGADGAVMVWAASDGQWARAPREPALTFVAHGGGTTGLAFGPDDRFLLTGGGDNLVKVWRLTGTLTLAGPPRVLRGHDAAVRAVAVSPDGTSFASASQDGTVKLWDERTEQDPLGLAHQAKEVVALGFDRDGTRLAAAGKDGQVYIWSAGQTGPPLRLEAAFKDRRVASLAFFPDGRLATAGTDGEVKVWEFDAEPRVGFRHAKHRGKVNALAVSPDGQYLASCGGNHEVRLCTLGAKGAAHFVGEHDDPVQCLAFAGDGKVLASADKDGVIKIWDVSGPAGRLVGQIKATHAVTSLAFWPKRAHLAAAVGKYVQVWDVSDPNKILPLDGFEGHLTTIVGLAFSADGTRLISASEGGTVKVWNTGRYEATPRAAHEELLSLDSAMLLSCLAVSADGRHIAAGGQGAAVRLWDSTDRWQR
jgi:WD40 repeat protein